MPTSFSEAGVPSRYRAKRELGRGGMSIVFLADDVQTSSEVAVKLLRPELVASVSAARFAREIQYLRVLQHRNILPILNASEESPALYLVTPFIDGPTLHQKIRLSGGALTLGETAAIVRQLADALDYAHERNIVHLDLKPENVLFDSERAVLCDFGIARAITVSANEERLSSSGIVVGTPSYMSPEQILHEEPIDGRSDIYALGCVTYEMLTGGPPFHYTNPQVLLASLLSRDPPFIRPSRPDIPAGVEEAVSRALSRERSGRPKRASALAEALDTIVR